MTEPEETGPVTREYKPGPVRGCGLTIGMLIVWGLGAYVIELVYISIHGFSSILTIDMAAASFLWAFIVAVSFWAIAGETEYVKQVGLNIQAWFSAHWLIGAVTGGAGVFVALGVIELAGNVSISTRDLYVAGAQELGPVTWNTAIAVFILYAGEEEIILRGLVYPLLKRSMGIVIALIFSSLIFTGFHILNNGFSAIPFFGIFLAGAFMALMRELTGNLWLAWGAHFGWNFTLISLGLPVSGYLVHIEPVDWHFRAAGPQWVTGGGFGPEGGLSGVVATLLLCIVTGYLVVLKNKREKSSAESETPSESKYLTKIP